MWNECGKRGSFVKEISFVKTHIHIQHNNETKQMELLTFRHLQTFIGTTETFKKQQIAKETITSLT